MPKSPVSLMTGIIERQKRLDEYMRDFEAYQHELNFLPPAENTLLARSVPEGSNLRMFNLTVAYPKLQFPRDLAERMQRNNKAAEEEILGAEFVSLNKQAEEFAADIDKLQQIMTTYDFLLGKEALWGVVKIDDVRRDLRFVLSGYKSEEVTKLLSKANVAPTILADIEHFYQHEQHTQELPKLNLPDKELDKFKRECAEICGMLAMGLLQGAVIEDLIKIEPLMAEFDELVKQRDTLKPKPEEVNAKLKHLFDNRLKPAVLKWMAEMQGINEVIKPDNVFICDGSSSRIIRAALLVSAMINSPEPKAKPSKKAVLVFGRSWDGFKKIVPQEMYYTDIIDGSVSAESLESFIRAEVLGLDVGEPFDITEARKVVKQGVGALILNIPENPIGKIPSEQEMQALAQVIAKYDIPAVISDEIFAVPNFKSISTYPDMASRTYVTSSTSKVIPFEHTLSFGYSHNSVFAKALSLLVNKDQQVVDGPVSVGFSTILESLDASYYEGNQCLYATNRRLINDEMDSINNKVQLSEGIGWLIEPNYGCLGVLTFPRELTDKAEIISSVQLCEYIYKTCAVATLPSGDVNPNPNEPVGVRINFSGPPEMVVGAIKRLEFAILSIKEGIKYSDIAGDKLHGEAQPELAAETKLREMLANALGQGDEGKAKVVA